MIGLNFYATEQDYQRELERVAASDRAAEQENKQSWINLLTSTGQEVPAWLLEDEPEVQTSSQQNQTQSVSGGGISRREMDEIGDAMAQAIMPMAAELAYDMAKQKLPAIVQSRLPKNMFYKR